jgi:hypothetical protein
MRRALLGILLLCFCSCSLRLPVEPYPESEAEASVASGKSRTVEVWMHDDGFHTGLIFDYPWLLESGYVPPKGLGTPPQVVMSWGNTDAYSENGISGPHKWMQVLFTPTDSVMELIPIRHNPVSVKPNQRLLKAEFPADRGPRLAHFLNQCQRTGEDGRPKVVRPSSWGDGMQVEGRFNYFIPRVCNIWSAQAIESLGGKVRPMQATTAKSLGKQLMREPNNFKLVHNGLE